MNEADTCRQLVVPKLQSAGWETEPHSIAEQRTITDGRIVPAGNKTAAGGLQQAKGYALMLGLKFAYATNGHDILEFDFLTGIEQPRTDYPTPGDLWKRYQHAAGLREP